MHLHFEQNISSRTECTIHSLTWMGKVPDSLTGDTNGGWKLNRGQYYSEGWLASGNAKGIVGVTFTASHCRKYDPPNRSNFNLRGHRSEVVLVRWNEPYQKLATCDSQGIIFVWIKHEGRWSIELINDRNSQVTDFAWSHDGRMALICYCDGFVLVGSVAGQRYWSSMLNLDNTSITCGAWSPDDQKVIFGTTDGQLLVMTSTGAMVSQISVHEGMEITSILWSCEKFNMAETESNQDTGLKVTALDSDSNSAGLSDKAHTLAVCFRYGVIYFMSNYDDVCPRVVHSMLTGVKIDWSNCGQYLAVGGFTRLPNLQCQNKVHFYSPTGDLQHWVSVPSQGKPLTALCWGHNDRRLFVAAGHNLYVAWIVKHVPSLQYLCHRGVQRVVKTDQNIIKLPLPAKLCLNVQTLFSPTIKSYIPDPFKLREFVSTPPPGAERLFCTMIRHGEENSGGHYTLYLEYLGGLIPLLKGKRASKLRPDFVIFDPKIKAKSVKKEGIDVTVPMVETDIYTSSSSSDSDIETDGCGGSPRVHRKKRVKTFRAEKVERSTTFRTLNELFYNDSLPESSKLVEVMSNIWGTKFRITGVASHLPEDLGNVLYKTSLLHLQPRQMTVTLSEMPRDPTLLAQDRHYSPAGMADDDPDRLSPIDGLLSNVHNEYYMNNNTVPDTDLLTNHNSGIITVDVLTNQVELTNHTDHVTETNSVNSSISTCSAERQKSVCLNTKLSPASETHVQNNHAFYNEAFLDEPGFIRDGCGEGARPKLPRQHLPCTNQNVSDDSGVISLTVNNSNVIASGTIKPSHRSSQSDSTQPQNLQYSTSMEHRSNINSPVGDYFFTNRDSSHHSESSADDSKSQCSAQKNIPSFVGTYIRCDIQDNIPRWADPACQGLKFVDEDDTSMKDFESNIVCDSSHTVTPTSDTPKRLYLKDSHEIEVSSAIENAVTNSNGNIDAEEDEEMNGDTDLDDSLSETNELLCHSPFTSALCSHNNSRKSSLINDFKRLEITQSASLPASPIHSLHKSDSPSKKLREEVLMGKCKHHSPLFKRKTKLVRSADTFEDDNMSSAEDIRVSYKNLESFQKAQLKQKLKRVRSRGEEKKSRYHQVVMHNKAPLWNENSQVYQLDFGGRVTQESAKNFQIEYRGKQVMQFGRIDSNAYTLDFQYPFTAVQAFAVALANVTQRLK